MRIEKLFTPTIVLCFGALFAFAQPTQNKVSDPVPLDPYQKIALRNNALELAQDVGKRTSELDIRKKLELRLETAIVLFKYDEPAALKLLEAAWRDTFSDEIKNEFYVNLQRKEILSSASKFAPERAEKWLKEISGKKPEDEQATDVSPAITDRQKISMKLKSLNANLSANPQEAVTAAISSLKQTGIISGEIVSLVEGLAQAKRMDLISTVYKAVGEFVKDRASSDRQDILAVIGLLVNPSATLDDRNRLLEFLLNSGKQIVISQNSNQPLPKLSNAEMFSIYLTFASAVKPFVEREMREGLGPLTLILQDLSAFLSEDQRSNPRFNSDPIEKQIEDVAKTVGSKERDLKYVNIATWLLTGRKRDEGSSLKLAASVADKISDSQTKDYLRDFIKLGLIENSITEKNLSAAEKTALTMTTYEIKSWVLMALAEYQKSAAATSLDLFDASLTALQKARPSHYRTQQALVLSSLMIKNDQNRSLDILSDAAKYAGKAEDTEEKINLNILYISSDIGELNFTSTDLFIKSSEIYVPGELGKLAAAHWDSAVSCSNQISPLFLRLALQLTLAKSALDYTGKSNKQPNESIKTP